MASDELKPNFQPTKTNEDFGIEKKLGLRLFTRTPSTKEVGEAMPVFSSESVPKLYVKINGKLYKVDLTAV